MIFNSYYYDYYLFIHFFFTYCRSGYLKVHLMVFITFQYIFGNVGSLLNMHAALTL